VPEGFTLELLEWLKSRKNITRGRLSEFAKEHKLRYLQNEKPRWIQADIVLPCATQNELSLEDAKMIVSHHTQIVAEWANMPTTLEATDYLIDHGVRFAPGKAANAWWVATSGLEMSQNSLRLSRSSEEVDQRLQEIMKTIHQTCVRYGAHHDGTNYVIGANIGWFIKVADAMLAQGIV
jgi:glutamate dehydrogenase (NADP+)